MAYENIINWTYNFLKAGRTPEEIGQHLLNHQYTQEQVIYILAVARQRLEQSQEPIPQPTQAPAYTPEPTPKLAPEIPEPSVPAAPKLKFDKKIISIIAVVIMVFGSLGAMYFGGFFGGTGNQSTGAITGGSSEIAEGTPLGLGAAFASSGAKCDVTYGGQNMEYWIKNDKIRMESSDGGVAIYLSDKTYLYDASTGWTLFPALELSAIKEPVQEISNLGGTVNCYAEEVNDNKFEVNA